jgi:hypothetical protein
MPPVDGEPESSPGTEENLQGSASPQSSEQTVDASSEQSSSSGADDGDKPKSTLDLIDQVLGGKKPSEGSPPSADPVKDPKSEPKADQPKADEKEPPFHTHPRWIELNKKLTDAEADAGEYRAIQTFAENSGMSIDDLADALQLAALVRNDPAKAREHVVAILDSIDNFTGEKLPKDLEDAVANGEITEDRARELSRARASVARSETASRRRSEQERSQRQTQEQQDQETERRKAVSTAVKSWEAETRKLDPDFDQKKDFIKDRIKVIIAERGSLPQSAEDGVAIAKQAYTEATSRLKGLMPKPRARATMPSIPGSSQSAPEKPKNTLDLINRVVGG